jgi:hypothetical protein
VETETPSPTPTETPTITPTATATFTPTPNYYVELTAEPSGVPVRIERSVSAGELWIIVLLFFIAVSLWAMYFAWRSKGGR